MAPIFAEAKAKGQDQNPNKATTKALMKSHGSYKRDCGLARKEQTKLFRSVLGDLNLTVPLTVEGVTTAIKCWAYTSYFSQDGKSVGTRLKNFVRRNSTPEVYAAGEVLASIDVQPLGLVWVPWILKANCTFNLELDNWMSKAQ